MTCPLPTQTSRRKDLSASKNSWSSLWHLIQNWQRHLKAILAQSTSLLKFPSQLPLSNQTPLTPSVCLLSYSCTPSSLHQPPTPSAKETASFLSPPCHKSFPATEKNQTQNRWAKSYSLLLLQEVKELRRKRYNQSSSPKRLDFSNL